MRAFSLGSNDHMKCHRDIVIDIQIFFKLLCTNSQQIPKTTSHQNARKVLK